jgi:gluconate 2-dehydrogenase gamma chain
MSDVTSKLVTIGVTSTGAMSPATVTRRDVIRAIALALTGAGILDPASAQQVHRAAEAAKSGGAYTPQALTAHEFATVHRLAELIIPADDVSGSAVEAGAPEFIDVLCSGSGTLADIYRGGILWLDNYVLKEHGERFVDGTAEQQDAVLAKLVEAEAALGERKPTYRRAAENTGYREYLTEPAPGLAPGARFFDWVRKMTVDAFYTSPIGYKDVGYMGNIGMTKYEVPDEVIAYLKRNGTLA